ncbi:Hypothetical predicted protein [Podarcis lilfordi]|uniref:Uncharacterized protein n=1 Tax=Podarcis lilfordi TaxID=74358 RepID=A0AA35K8J6_9SAUR|nr:Hypothetical predicted protein [Podarcis lilfordi]
MRSSTLQVFVILFLVFLPILCFESLFLFQGKDLFAEKDLDFCEVERPPLDTSEKPLGDRMMAARPPYPSFHGGRREAAALEPDQVRRSCLVGTEAEGWSNVMDWLGTEEWWEEAAREPGREDGSEPKEWRWRKDGWSEEEEGEAWEEEVSEAEGVTGLSELGDSVAECSAESEAEEEGGEWEEDG